MTAEKSEQLFRRAVACIPGGVNSPVRAYGAVGIAPRFIERADGSRIYDADGNSYIDFLSSWGPCILGHNDGRIREAVTEACSRGLSFGCATEAEVELAEFVCTHIPSIEMIRMVNSGTEAVMSALRVARGFTGRDKVIKFAGCYHGHSDGMLVSAGSGAMSSGVPDSAGVTPGCTQDTMVAVYNDLGSVERLLEENSGQVAAVIVEPVGANMGVVLPEEGFLPGLRRLCDRHQALLIFDEVITGFRLGFTGAQGYYNVRPDLTTYGKIIGAGMPIGAYGGRKDIMGQVAPSGPVYQAGTLSGNPVAMAAGLAQLTILQSQPDIYQRLSDMGELLYGGMKALIEENKIPCQVNHIQSLGCLFFTADPVTDYASAKRADTSRYAAYFKHMLESGIHLAPAQFEAMFLSAAHTEEDLAFVLEAVKNYFKTDGFMLE